MVLKKLEIKNFRGLKDYEIEFNRKLNILEGKNGSGKTTILESILWLFTGETVGFGRNVSRNKNVNNDEEIAVKGILYNGDIIERDLKGLTKNGEKIESILNIPTFNYVNNLERLLMDYNEFQSIQGNTLMWVLFYALGIDKKELLEKYQIKENDLIRRYKFWTEKNLEIIKENEKVIADLENQFESGKLEELTNLRKEYDTTLEKYSNEQFEKKADLKAISERLQNANKNIIDKQNAINSEILPLKSEIETNKAVLTKEIEDLNYKILDCNWRIENADNQLATKNDTIKLCCPECGYVLNQDEITRQEERIKHYTERKQIALEELNNYNAELKEKQNKLEELNNELTKLAEKFDLLNNTDEMQELQNEINSLMAEQTASYDNFMAIKNTKLKEIKDKMKNLAKYEDMYEQIDLLKRENKYYMHENETFEMIQKRVEAFYQDTTIKDKLNKAFPTLEFQFDDYYDKCIITFKNIPYDNVNDGDKITIGIIFAENLKNVLKIESLPILFDRSSDLDTDNLQKILKMTNSQIITTRVSDDEKITVKEN